MKSAALIAENQKLFEAAERQQFFAMFRRAFEEAAQNVGEIKEFYFEVAAQKICLRFAGEDALFSHLTRALSHLAAEPVKTPDLTFLLWDTISTRRTMPVLIEVLIKCVQQCPWLVERGQRGEDLCAVRSKYLYGSVW